MTPSYSAHSMHAYVLLLLLVGAERIVEVGISRAHVQWYRRRGGVEHGAAHYPYMVALHLGLLFGCLLEVILADRPFIPMLGWPMLALVLAAEGLRWWCISTLGRRWTTRVMVVPGLPPIRTGPYRVLRHPNYLAVVVEGFALPLVHTAWLTAIVFSVLNGVLLVERIKVENLALTAAYPSTGHPDPPTGPIRQVPPQPPRGTEPPGPPDQAAS